MARNLNMAFFVAMAAAAMMINSAVAATTYQVGDTMGWAIPSGGASYATWASNKKFAVGDTLVFTYASGVHDVAEVTKAAYDSCSATAPISLSTSTPTNIVLASAGEKYYICTFGGHCSAGQKLTVTVAGTSSPAPAPTTPTTPPPSTSPPASVPTPPPSTTTPTPGSAPAPSTTTPTPGSAPAPSTTTPTPTPGSAPTPSTTTPTPGSAPTPSTTTPTPGSAPGGSTTPPAPTPTGTSEGPPAPPPSAAASLSAGLAGTFLSIALVMLY